MESFYPPEKLSTRIRYLCVLLGGTCVKSASPPKIARGWVERRRGLQGPPLGGLYHLGVIALWAECLGKKKGWSNQRLRPSVKKIC